MCLAKQNDYGRIFANATVSDFTKYLTKQLTSTTLPMLPTIPILPASPVLHNQYDVIMTYSKEKLHEGPKNRTWP